MTTNAKFRVWLRDRGCMDTSPDCLINTHGNVYTLEDGKLVPQSAVVMRNTGYETRGGHHLFELDIVSLDGKYGIVYYSDYAYIVHFLESGEKEWLDTLELDEENLEMELDYFTASVLDVYKGLAAQIPYYILAQYGIYRKLVLVREDGSKYVHG